MYYSWNQRQAGGGANKDQTDIVSEADGFASLSRRFVTSKPIIAAVNGGAYGGGMEIILNCDIVVVVRSNEIAKQYRSIFASFERVARVTWYKGH